MESLHELGRLKCANIYSLSNGTVLSIKEQPHSFTSSPLKLILVCFRSCIVDINWQEDPHWVTKFKYFLSHVVLCEHYYVGNGTIRRYGGCPPPPTTHLEQNKERIAVQVNYLHLAEPE